jgi:peptidoglycan/xylan/chitin deacetylase (PgdA/CDA1 family)
VTGVNALKEAIKHGLATPLGWRVAGRLVRPPGVIVLMYHRLVGPSSPFPGISPEMFATEMRWLRDNCDPIEPEELIARAQGRRRSRPAVLVTFDDGYRDYHDLAYPVLKQLRIPAVVFLATSFMDAGGMLWTEEVQLAAQSTRQPSVRLPWSDSQPIPLRDAAARVALGERARTHLKRIPNAERRAAMAALFEALGGPPVVDRQMLTWDEVRATSELTRFGGHSHTHPILSRVNAEEAESEIRTCRDRIAAETGIVPTLFAYPNGGPADYTGETQAILRRNGFRLAFSTSTGIAGPSSDWMAIKRVPGEALKIGHFAWTAAGF